MNGRYGYERSEQGEGIADQVIDRTKEAAETARGLGEEALDRADEWLRPVGLSIKEQPMTCLALVAGLAFAAGAVWMVSRGRQQGSYTDALRGRWSDLPGRAKAWQ